MALFGRKPKPARTTPVPTESGGKEEAPITKDDSPKTETTSSRSSDASDLSHVLRNPRITEKASEHMGIGIYAFDVAPRATKRSIEQAVFALYNVRPRAIHIVNIPKKVKRNMRTGKSGVLRGGKKAYVYLKKGDTITVT